MDFCIISFSPMEVPITRQEFVEQTKMLRRLVDIHVGLNKTLELEQKALWDDTDMMRYFGLSKRTLVRRREDETFKFTRVGASYRYKREDMIGLCYQKNKSNKK